MWFATQDGLNRFDGINFKIYPRSFDNITNPENSRLGKLQIYGNTLWMITRGGRLENLDLTTEEFVHIRNFYTGKSLPAVRSILIESRNKIWIGTERDGLYLVNEQMEILKHLKEDEKSASSLISNKINDIFLDSVGNLWILTDEGINKLSDNRIEIYLEGVYANTIIEDYAERLYLGTQEQGIYIKDRYYNEFNQIKNSRKIPVPADITVKSLFLANNRLWIGTYGSGVFIIDQDISKLHHCLPDSNEPHSIGFQDILSIFPDDKGGVWIGTDGGGISFHDQAFGNFRLLIEQHVPEEIAVEQIRAITTDKNGGVWLGTSGSGLTFFDPEEKQFEPYHLKPHKPGLKNYNRIVALESDASGDIWIGTHGNGTLIMDPKTGTIKKWFTKDAVEEDLKVPDNTMWTFLKEGSGSMWAGTRFSGLVLIDKEKGVLKRFYDRGSNQDNIRAIQRINDSVLAIGYERKGIRLLNTEDGTFKDLLPEFFADELDQVEIKCLYYLNDWLWTGTGGKGIVAINLKTEAVKRFTELDGLPNSMIYGILEEDSRTFWASSNRGLFRLTYKKEDGELRIDKINSFNQSNGLQSNEFNTGAFHRSKQGILYFGGVKGLNFFDPLEIPNRREKIPIVISEALVDNVPFKGKKLVPYENKLNLKYRENSIAVNYTAINFVSPEKLNYTYKLEGYDENWIQAGPRNYTAYTNLPPGDYVFQVKLADNMIDDAPVTSLGISVATPYWKAWWFVLLLVVFVLLLLYTIYKVRINQILELQKVKDAISADLHDDLGSRLTTIHLLSAISKSKFEKHPDLSKVLGKTDREIYASSEALDEIVWNIKMTDESLTDIIAKIRRYISEVLENDDIEYTIDTTGNFQPYNLSMQKRRELFLICKELINNIRKHAKATRIDLKITPDHNMLYVSVLDNGKGFNPQQITHRNGISNLRKRISKRKGRLNISSEPDKGCLIEIWIPFDRTNILKKIFQRE